MWLFPRLLNGFFFEELSEVFSLDITDELELLAAVTLSRDGGLRDGSGNKLGMFGLFDKRKRRFHRNAKFSLVLTVQL